MIASSPLFVQILKEVGRQLNLLPPSGAIAGVYARVDSSEGVWSAPATVSLNAVESPAVEISNDEQLQLNDDLQGKSINAIRSFEGRGILVWGTRTLDGTSADWRYINVRRTMIMLEQSIKRALESYVFAGNVAATWIAIKSSIQNFLTGIWRQGGLAGEVPADAFRVSCGLGETMTAEDILDGFLRVTVCVAPARPAEFLEITIQQQMQSS